MEDFIPDCAQIISDCNIERIVKVGRQKPNYLQHAEILARRLCIKRYKTECRRLKYSNYSLHIKFRKREINYTARGRQKATHTRNKCKKTAVYLQLITAK